MQQAQVRHGPHTQRAHQESCEIHLLLAPLYLRARAPRHCKAAAAILTAGRHLCRLCLRAELFGALLKDPQTQQPLETVAFDILSPAEKTDNFVRRPWQSVDATTLPQGELVIGLNPPFGHQNREAIEFVEHALCAKPRMLVLIMPMTNYTPNGYECLVHDDQLCKGYAFYAPGTNTSNWINAAHVTPVFQVYRRKEGVSTVRAGRCQHFMRQVSQVTGFKRTCQLQKQHAATGAKR